MLRRQPHEKCAASPMKKKLILIRHAKSSWEQADLDDFDRPLSKRGERNAPEMGRRLLASAIQPDLLLSSPARRALSTATAIAQELGYPLEAIQQEFDFYLSGACTMLRVLRAQDDRYHTIMLFGHNEAITDFANMLSPYYLDNIPTAGVVGISFAVSSWAEVRKGRFGFYDYPKNEHPQTYQF
ncbi:MAG: histidine phosphatase family protein [Gammaproteobacteria bacterium]|nr:histidine phosphatase family protein [Gammaproteobacteria bacterium]NHN38065.1 histidine phosphatase family protein [Pseudomaricurvus alcaniphilus]